MHLGGPTHDARRSSVPVADRPRPAPSPAERRREIVATVDHAGAITIAQLQLRFGISPMTARRDLDALEAAGRVGRTHGGAVPVKCVPRAAVSATDLIPSSAEEAFACAGLRSISDGETLFLDATTAAHRVAELLVRDARTVNVITNGLRTAALLSRHDRSRIGVVLIGGAYRHDLGAFVGTRAEKIVTSHWADVAVLGRAPTCRPAHESPSDLGVRRLAQLMAAQSERQLVFWENVDECEETGSGA